MSLLLAIWRTAFLVVFTSAMFVLVLLSRVVLAFAPDAWRRCRTALFRFWARTMARVLDMRIEVRGPRPDSPFMLVANHLSYLDIVLLASHLRTVFVAKSEVAGWPVLGPMVRSMNTIFIDRGNRRDLVRANGEIDAALSAGDGVVLFAEGSSSDGETVLPFRPSLLEVAMARNYPVHYARLAYYTPEGAPPPGKAICWWDNTPLVPHILRLFRLPHFHALLHFGSDTVAGTDRKQVAKVLREKVCALPVSLDGA